jgi:hypothetical protein
MSEGCSAGCSEGPDSACVRERSYAHSFLVRSLLMSLTTIQDPDAALAQPGPGGHPDRSFTAGQRLQVSPQLA